MSATPITATHPARSEVGGVGVYPVLARLGGLLLVAAGAIKLMSGTVPEPSGVTSLLLPDWTLAVVPAYEIALGGWLLADRWRFWAWLVTVFTLGVFALHDLELTAAGRASCGCLGAASPAPGFMLPADVVALLLLLERRPGCHGWPADTPALRLVGTAAGVTAVTLGTVAIGAHLRYGSLAVALADVRGDPVAVDPAPLTLASADPGSQVERAVRLANLSGEPVVVTAAHADCRCAVFYGLPLTLEPGGRADVRIVLTVPRGSGGFRRRVAFETSAGLVPLAVRGTVREQPGTPGE